MEYLINVFWYTVPFVVVLSILIFVHEMGHYLVAKWAKVKVDEFSLGFGKKLLSKKDKSGTEWKICAVPFGGYVKMHGDQDASSKPDLEKLNKMTEEEKAGTFYNKKLYQRFAIIFAGPFFNYIFAILCFILLFMTYGQQVTKPLISEVVPNSAAYEAGLKEGDNVLFYNNEKVKTFEDLKYITTLNFDKTMPIIVERDGIQLSLEITPKIIETKSIFGESTKSGVIGILSTEVEFIKHTNLFDAVGESFNYCNKMITGTLKAIGQIVTGTRSGAEMGGPLKIAKLSKDFAEQGMGALIFFVGLLSANLALINLFPIPVLDGGHLLFYIIEAIVRRPVPDKIQEICFKTGLYLILLLAVVITFNDIKSMFF